MGAYVVVENTPGYLPETEPATFADFGSAVDYAQSLLRSLLDEYAQYADDGESDEVTVIHTGSRWEAYVERDAHDLGRVIEVTWAPEAEVEEE